MFIETHCQNTKVTQTIIYKNIIFTNYLFNANSTTFVSKFFFRTEINFDIYRKSLI